MTILRLFPFPMIFRGELGGTRNANNNLFRIAMDKGLPAAQPFAAVLAQERFEWGYKWRRFAFFADKVEMELRGHAVEAYVAMDQYGFDLPLYEEGEAQALSFYPQFAGMAYGEILVELRRRRAIAREWCQKHNSFIAWACAKGSQIVQ